jgi:dienelactone hydrolase
MLPRFSFRLLLCVWSTAWAAPFPEKTPDTPGNRMLDQYFAQEVSEIEQTGGVADVASAEDWKAKAPEYRRQLRGMLGLDPMPARTPLQATITGTLNGDGFVVEKLHYQAIPGLYVTANLYRPAKVEGKLPTILYVCGHALVEKNGISYGNKTAYHHHGVWFARHGYVCMIIDTVELGEIRGEHHGTYSKGRWWWLSRGYTPAGLEAWQAIRGLDYLETRPEVDKERFGITGRSGGGSYSWWTAAIDERIKAAAPTAGITSIRNHVVDGTVEGHCDCMFAVNTQRWDYDRVAALIAPRALLVCNTDKDAIFPIDGVFKVYQNARRIYSLLGVEKNIGLQVAEGPHKDLQPLNTGAFHWFERFLKGADPMQVIDEGARKCLEAEDLKVFKELPKDQINTRVDEVFVPQAKSPAVAASKSDWEKQREAWMADLRDQVFHGWPKDAGSVVVTKDNSSERDGIRMTAYDFESQSPVRLRLYVAHRAGLRPEDLELVALNVLDAQGWQEFCDTYESRFAKLIDTFPTTHHDEKAFASEKGMFESFKWGMAYLCPRGIGPTEWTGSDKAQTQRLRRFYLLGQTVDGMRVWDVRRGVQACKLIPGLEKTPLWIQSSRDMAVNCLYASLFEDGITRLDLHEMPVSHQQGPAYLNVLKYLDIPQAAAMALERTRVIVYDDDAAKWSYVGGTAKLLHVPEKQWQVRKGMGE